MIVRDLPHAAAGVDGYALAAARDPLLLLEHVHEVLKRQIDDWALAHALDVPRRSLWWIEERIEPTDVIRFTVTWSPDPVLGCEFRGGPADGLLLALPRSDGVGRPPHHYALPQPAPTAFDATAANVLTSPIPVAHLRYDLAGVDPVMDRWVYEA